MAAPARPWWEAVVAVVIATQLAVAVTYVARHDMPRTAASVGPCLVRGADRAVVDELLDLCLVAVPAVTSVWGQNWARRAVLVVAPGEEGVAAVVRGGEVEVDPASFAELSEAGKQVVITHEVTHLATKAVRGQGVPTWLIEGFADYVGYLRSGIPLGVAAQELQTEVRAGRVPRALPSEAAFDGASLPSVYAQSWLAVWLLVRTYGQACVVRLYRAVLAGTPVERALPLLMHLTLAELTTRWRAGLQRVLR